MEFKESFGWVLEVPWVHRNLSTYWCQPAARSWPYIRGAGEPGKPGEPGEPGNPREPGNPWEPDNPGEQGGPGESGEPREPDEPGKKGKTRGGKVKLWLVKV